MSIRWFREFWFGTPAAHPPASRQLTRPMPRSRLLVPTIQFRQGDVLLVAVDGLPAAARKRPRRGRIILATGEATGHAHAIVEPDAEEFRVGGERFVLVRSRAQLIHEEHTPIDVPAGTYRVVIQREFDPASTASRTAWRRIAD